MWSVQETGRHSCSHLLKWWIPQELQKQKRKEEMQIWKRSRGLPFQSECRYFTRFNFKWSAVFPSGINPLLWVTGLRINCSQLTEPEQKARVQTDPEPCGGMTLGTVLCRKCHHWLNNSSTWGNKIPDVQILEWGVILWASSLQHYFHHLQHVWYFT